MSNFYFCVTELKTIVMTPVRGHSRKGRKAQRENKLLRITDIYYVSCVVVRKLPVMERS